MSPRKFNFIRYSDSLLFHKNVGLIDRHLKHYEQIHQIQDLTELNGRLTQFKNSSNIHLMGYRQSPRAPDVRNKVKFPNVRQNILKSVRRRLNQFIIQVLEDTSATSMFTRMYVCKSCVPCFSKSRMENSKPLLYSYSLSLWDNSGPQDRFLHNFTASLSIGSPLYRNPLFFAKFLLVTR